MVNQYPSHSIIEALYFGFSNTGFKLHQQMEVWFQSIAILSDSLANWLNFYSPFPVSSQIYSL